MALVLFFQPVPVIIRNDSHFLKIYLTYQKGSIEWRNRSENSGTTATIASRTFWNSEEEASPLEIMKRKSSGLVWQYWLSLIWSSRSFSKRTLNSARSSGWEIPVSYQGSLDVSVLTEAVFSEPPKLSIRKTRSRILISSPTSMIETSRKSLL